MLIGEPQTPHFYDSWIFEPVTKPQNQYYLFWETPRYLTKLEIQWNIKQQLFFYKSNNFGNPKMSNVEKTRAEKNNEGLPCKQIQSHGYEINIYQQA